MYLAGLWGREVGGVDLADGTQEGRLIGDGENTVRACIITKKSYTGGQVSLARMIDPAPCRSSVRKVAIRWHRESMIGDEKKRQRRAGDATAIKYKLVSLHMEGEGMTMFLLCIMIQNI
jgi:hypothetical protein